MPPKAHLTLQLVNKLKQYTDDVESVAKRLDERIVKHALYQHRSYSIIHQQLTTAPAIRLYLHTSDINTDADGYIEKYLRIDGMLVRRNIPAKS